ncbi:hypothetical protein GIB67_016771 [Kingdonia uniflora]|uniref:SHSP domain-containing protein n=1 Tax=Kingdonia uniflora TaxID=39325 RepID=A0A7J7LXX6_9MAGN|nr:hypothetical protein GIB67_016771 [Kingdonia uniflora]
MMNRLMDVDPVLSRGGFFAPVSTARRGWDVKENEDRLNFQIDMPGLGKEYVKVSVEKNKLIIKVKMRRSRRTSRREERKLILPEFNLKIVRLIMATQMDGLRFKLSCCCLLFKVATMETTALFEGE